MRYALALAFLSAASSFSQQLNPVKWTAAVEPSSVAPGKTLRARVIAKLDPGWHIYSLTTPAGGPTPTTIKLAADSPFSPLKLYQPAPARKFDPNFKIDTEVFENEAVFVAEMIVPANSAPGSVDIPLLVRYQACTEKECLPRRATLTAAVAVDPGASASAPAIPSGYKLAGGPSAPTPSPSATSEEPQTLAGFLLLAFGVGLAAIFTPCVFPMIPITLSFFLNRPGTTRKDTLTQAAIFCLGIVVLFTALGLSIAAIVGPFGVLQLGSNPWVNGFIALIFLVFGLSLLGAYEFTLPSGMLTRLDRVSQKGGLAGTLMMGLTFSLTSFACVGPFVGTLLAGSVQRGGVQPALGMMSFAAGLSAPFFVLALFPAFLQRLPRSGGWLARVKIVLGFVVLAWMLKYLSSVDQVLQWNVLTRERFLAAWFILFALPGLYLLGFLRMEGVKSDESVGVGRILAGAVFLIFALTLIPGMFGGKLGEIDSYVPLATETAAFDGSRSGQADAAWVKNDFDAALAKARAENKPILIAFTGYACTNCHWMKANLLTKPEVAELLRSFVLVELYTDGTDAMSEKNQKLQESKFGTVAIPYYAIMDADQRVLGSFAGLTRDVPKYVAFLRSAPLG